MRQPGLWGRRYHSLVHEGRCVYRLILAVGKNRCNEGIYWWQL